ncbi:hypothetical protein AGMMS49938_14860 [Fibrobacterales bacterium]|nr:hypothetical protein AGMMS49938_14860 [Fibrobacterales bacterium]
MRFAGLDPSELLASEPKAEVRAVSPEQITALYDSLSVLDFAIHNETDDRRLKNLKDVKKNLWERILLARNSLAKKEEVKTTEGDVDDLVDSLIKGISITAAILLAIIIFLLIKINRRHREVAKVTEKLKQMQSEPSPPPPLGTLDPTVFSRTRIPLPQVKPMGDTTPPKPTVPTPTLRPTARQRVTEAVKSLADALATLQGKKTKAVPTVSEKTVSDRTVSDRTLTGNAQTKTLIRVPSPNGTRIVPPGDETTYDRRSREKKQILDYAKQGRTPSEIAKWLELPRDQVETVIRLARERGE